MNERERKAWEGMVHDLQSMPNVGLFYVTMPNWEAILAADSELKRLREAVEWTDNAGAQTKEGDALGWWIFENVRPDMSTRHILRKFLAELHRRAKEG